MFFICLIPLPVLLLIYGVKEDQNSLVNEGYQLTFTSPPKNGTFLIERDFEHTSDCY